MNTSTTDILIIGAGPAGTVAASMLNEYGYGVKIVEKQQFPRFVIGESLLPRCMDNLSKAGFIDTIEQAGFQKKYGALFVNNTDRCEFDFSIQFTKGWSWTWQVQREKFDKVLADEVAKRGVDISYEKEVTDVHFHQDGSSTTTISGRNGKERVTARYLIDASGYGRVLPRLLELDRPSNFPSRSAFFCHVRPRNLSAAEERMRIIIIIYSQDIWGWVIPFNDGTSSIGLVGDTTTLQQYSGSATEQMHHWIATVPALRDRFTNCELVFEPRWITGYSSAVSQHYGKNYVLTGNSAEFVDPIFSSGVTFATESSARAAELIHRQLSGDAVDWQTEYSDYIQRGVDVFKSFIKHWYDGSLHTIFFNEQSSPEIRKQICSILAGYVWDLENPFVVKHKRAIPALANVLK